MKEILFKAKRIDNGEWVYGSYVYTFREDENCPVTCVQVKKHFIVEECGNMFWVDEDTICQYTGLTDKNGQRIWENDIVNCFEAECCGKISWNESEAGFYFDVLLEDGTYEEEHIYDYADCMEVIGNIFDNPELLESEE